MKTPKTYLKENEPTPLTEKDSVEMWNGVVSKLNLPQDQAVIPNPAFPLTQTLFLRPAYAFAAIVLLILGGGLTAQAANQSSPGDFLFPLDLAMENTRLAITSSTKQEGLRYQYALERVEELSSTISKAKSVQMSDSDKSTTEIEDHIKYVEQYLEKNEDGLQTEQRTRLQQAFDETTAVMTRAKEQNQNREQKTAAGNTAAESKDSETMQQQQTETKQQERSQEMVNTSENSQTSAPSVTSEQTQQKQSQQREAENSQKSTTVDTENDAVVSTEENDSEESQSSGQGEQKQSSDSEKQSSDGNKNSQNGKR